MGADNKIIFNICWPNEASTFPQAYFLKTGHIFDKNAKKIKREESLDLSIFPDLSKLCTLFGVFVVKVFVVCIHQTMLSDFRVLSGTFGAYSCQILLRLPPPCLAPSVVTKCSHFSLGPFFILSPFFLSLDKQLFSFHRIIWGPTFSSYSVELSMTMKSLENTGCQQFD